MKKKRLGRRIRSKNVIAVFACAACGEEHEIPLSEVRIKRKCNLLDQRGNYLRFVELRRVPPTPTKGQLEERAHQKARLARQRVKERAKERARREEECRRWDEKQADHEAELSLMGK